MTTAIVMLSILPVLLAASAFMSGSETALFAMSRQQLNRLRQTEHPSARMVLRLRGRPSVLLSTVLLANIAVNILLYSILAVTVARLGGESAILTAGLGMAGFFLVLTGAEILPKLLAFALSDRLALLVAMPIRVLEIVTSPVRWVLTVLFVEPLLRIFGGGAHVELKVSAEELQKLVDICQNEGLITERENALLHRVVDLASLRVRDLMVPRVDLVAFGIADSREDLVRLIRKRRLLRIPVFDEQIDNIKGLIHAKEVLLRPDVPLCELIRPVRFIPEQASVEALLQQFRATGSQLRLVVDEYGGIEGVIAMEDIIEALVGELYVPGETRRRPPLERVDDRTFIVDGGLDVQDFRRAFGLTLEDVRITTVGGLIAQALDRIPEKGDTVMIEHARLSVTRMRGRRILRARIELDEPPAENPDLTHLLSLAPGSESSNGGGGAG